MLHKNILDDEKNCSSREICVKKWILKFYGRMKIAMSNHGKYRKKQYYKIQYLELRNQAL